MSHPSAQAPACNAGVSDPDDRTPLEVRYRAAMTALGRIEVLAECLRMKRPDATGLATIIEHELASLQRTLRMTERYLDRHGFS